MGLPPKADRQVGDIEPTQKIVIASLYSGVAIQGVALLLIFHSAQGGSQ